MPQMYSQWIFNKGINMHNKGAGMMVHSLVLLPCKHKGIIPIFSPHDYNPSSGKAETGRSLRFVNEIPCLRGGGGGVPGDDTGLHRGAYVHSYTYAGTHTQKRKKKVQWEICFFHKSYRDNWLSTNKEWNWTLPSYKIISSKWIKDLNINPKSVKFLEGNTKTTLFDIGPDNNILDMISIE